MKIELITKAPKHVVDAIQLLEQLCFKTERLSPRQISYLITAKSTHVFLVIVRREIVGCGVVLTRKNSLHSRLYSFAIHPKHQGHGYASKLLRHIEKFSRSKRRFELRLEVRTDNRRAIRFYKTRGYEIFGGYDDYYEDGADAHRMLKYLNHVKLK